MDQLAAIRVFVTVAESASLSEAGRRLGMPLSTVSRHLKTLEDELETRLITRTTRRLMLTEPGRSSALEVTCPGPGRAPPAGSASRRRRARCAASTGW